MHRSLLKAGVVAAAITVANISTYDVTQSNGVIHVIDRVLLPR